MGRRPFRTASPLATVDKVTVVTGLFRRARKPVTRGRGALVLAAIVVTGSVVVPPAVASAGPSDPGPEQSADPSATIDATQAQVDAVEAEFATQQQTLAELSEQFDQATVHLAQVDAQLSSTEAQLAVAREKHAAARHALQVAAVNAYIFDTPSGELGSLFSAPSGPTALHDEYQQTALGNLDGAVQQLEASERQLSTTESALRVAAATGDGRFGASRDRAPSRADDRDRHRGDAHRGEGPARATRGAACRPAGRRGCCCCQRGGQRGGQATGGRVGRAGRPGRETRSGRAHRRRLRRPRPPTKRRPAQGRRRSSGPAHPRPPAARALSPCAAPSGTWASPTSGAVRARAAWTARD